MRWQSAGLAALALACSAASAAAQQQQSRAADMNVIARPIDAVDNVWMEEMTVLEVRDALRAGNTTALILTGEVENNGPYLPTGKHNYVMRAMGEAIARRLGRTLVAPIVTLAPGNPETTATPGGIVLSQNTYRAVLKDMAASLKTQGFRTIIMIGDNGGNQRPLEEVAQELTTAWGGSPGVHYIREYYYEDRWSCDYLKELGVFQQPDVCAATRDLYHDDYHYSSIIATLGDPDLIRTSQRRKAGLLSINGVELAPFEKLMANGFKLVERRTDITVRAIQKAMGVSSSN